MIQFRSYFLVSLLMVFATSPPFQSLEVFQETKQNGEVKIGLLIPDAKMLVARHGAEMAIHKANAKGGYNGRHFHLVVRSTEGPWGAGSKESVNLVYEDEVWAIMGSLDGRNAHLAEQVATKAHIVFLSSRATDQTLSQAFIPWYFRCVPNDRQQAKALTREIYHERQLKRIATLAEADNDARLGATSFAKIAVAEGMPSPTQFFYESSVQDFHDVLSQIESAGVEGIVLFGQPSSAAKIIRQIRHKGMKQALFGSLSLLADGNFLKSAGPDLEGAVLVSPDYWYTSGGKNFKQEFQEIYGYSPGVAAVYAYDGMNLIIEAIRKAGLDRDRIRDSLADIKYKDGVTGVIHFDDMGNRIGTVGLIEIHNGHPAVRND